MTAAISTWADHERLVHDLIDAESADGRPAVVGEPGWFPLTARPPSAVLRAAATLPSTPAVIWDLDALQASAKAMLGAFGAHGISLNVAVKACSSPGVLRALAELGLGCDVASMYEYQIVRDLGFTDITACGPSFRAVDIRKLNRAGAQFDVSSAGQLQQVAQAGVDSAGLRLRVPMPTVLESATSRGNASRFGIPGTRDLPDLLRTHRISASRLRVHTGESTSRTLRFRLRYALLVARLLGGVETVNLGGGFLRLARQEGALDQALALIAAELAEQRAAHDADGSPFPRLSVEPGGALVLDHAYLAATVLETEDHPLHGHTVTVDASAWNIAPWSKTTFHHVDRSTTDAERSIVYGPSLYEQDAFIHQSEGPDRHVFALGRCRTGDRLVGTSFGAYTLTNGRSFNGFPLPPQFALRGGELSTLE